MHHYNLIGLEKTQAEELAQSLNDLLANFQIFYQNLRGMHWNLAGEHFFELHVKFEELYLVAHTNIDIIAERVATLGMIPLHTFEDYLAQSEIVSAKNLRDGRQGMVLILSNLQLLLRKERAILDLSERLSDNGTNTMISDLIDEQEKTIWMVGAYLS